MSFFPPICKQAKTGLETKLLYYYHLKQTMKFELRYSDSTLYAPEDIPDCEGITEFLPLWEVGHRVFLFTKKVDMNRAKERLDGMDKRNTKKRKRRSRRPRA